MLKTSFLWNVRGLNSRARRNVVRDLVGEHHTSLVSLYETKLDNCADSLVHDTLGLAFDFFSLPAAHTCGGILLAWNRDVWSASCPLRRDFSLSARLNLKATGEEWWITTVYGPQSDRTARPTASLSRDMDDLW
jgi:exonuclease III